MFGGDTFTASSNGGSPISFPCHRCEPRSADIALAMFGARITAFFRLMSVVPAVPLLVGCRSDRKALCGLPRRELPGASVKSAFQNCHS